jgi:hypothetical protein
LAGAPRRRLESLPSPQFFGKRDPKLSGVRIRHSLSNQTVELSDPVIDHPDFSVVVKLRAPPPKSWRWEIYRAGRNSAIECSTVFFETMTEASRAGKVALGVMLSEHSD